MKNLRGTSYLGAARRLRAFCEALHALVSTQVLKFVSIVISLFVRKVAAITLHTVAKTLRMVAPHNTALKTDKDKLSCLLHTQKPRQLAFAAELGR